MREYPTWKASSQLGIFRIDWWIVFVLVAVYGHKVSKIEETISETRQPSPPAASFPSPETYPVIFSQPKNHDGTTRSTPHPYQFQRSEFTTAGVDNT